MTTSHIEAHLDLDKTMEALRLPLAFVESEERRSIIEAYLAAAKVYLDQSGRDLLAGIAVAINEGDNQLSSRVEHRPDGAWFVLDIGGEETPSETPTFAEGDLERVTLRLPREIKEAADGMAAAEGVSANTWYIRTLVRALRHALHRGGQQRRERPAVSPFISPTEPPLAPRRGNRRHGRGRIDDGRPD